MIIGSSPCDLVLPIIRDLLFDAEASHIDLDGLTEISGCAPLAAQVKTFVRRLRKFIRGSANPLPKAVGFLSTMFGQKKVHIRLTISLP